MTRCRGHRAGGARRWLGIHKTPVTGLLVDMSVRDPERRTIQVDGTSWPRYSLRSIRYARSASGTEYSRQLNVLTTSTHGRYARTISSTLATSRRSATDATWRRETETRRRFRNGKELTEGRGLQSLQANSRITTPPVLRTKMLKNRRPK